MKHVLTIISCFLAFNLTAQEVAVEYPYNPDFENDGNVGVEDLLQLLASFGMGFDVEEITIDEFALSEWLQAISETLATQQILIDSLMSNEVNSGLGQLDSALIADMINEAGSAAASFGERVVLKEFQETTSQELEDWFSEIPLSPGWYYGEFDFDTDGILHLGLNYYSDFDVAIIPDSISLEEVTVNEIWDSVIEELGLERSWSIALHKGEKLVFVSGDANEHEDIFYASWLPLESEVNGEQSVQTSIESIIVDSLFAQQDEVYEWRAHSHFTIDESVNVFAINSPEVILSGYDLDQVVQIHVHLHLPISESPKEFELLLNGLSFCNSGYQLEIYSHIDGNDLFTHYFSGNQPCMMAHDNRFKWSYYRIDETWFAGD